MASLVSHMTCSMVTPNPQCTPMQWSLDRTGDFSLITKLRRKYKICAVVSINYPSDHATPSFDSTALICDQSVPHIYAITTHTLTTTHIPDEHVNTIITYVLHNYTESTCENKFYGHSAISTESFFGITYTLTGVILHGHIK